MIIVMIMEEVIVLTMVIIIIKINIEKTHILWEKMQYLDKGVHILSHGQLFLRKELQFCCFIITCFTCQFQTSSWFILTRCPA